MQTLLATKNYQPRRGYHGTARKGKDIVTASQPTINQVMETQRPALDAGLRAVMSRPGPREGQDA